MMLKTQIQKINTNSLKYCLLFAWLLLTAMPIAAMSDRYSPPPDSCSDLQIDSIRVLEYKKKCYVVEYTLSNKGTAPAPLFGTKRKLTDNIILRAYFSGDRRLNRGDAEAGAAYIKKGTGILLPGESYTGIMEVDRRLETNYISIVLLQVDAFSTLRECDETNNVSWIILD